MRNISIPEIEIHFIIEERIKELDIEKRAECNELMQAQGELENRIEMLFQDIRMFQRQKNKLEGELSSLRDRIAKIINRVYDEDKEGESIDILPCNEAWVSGD